MKNKIIGLSFYYDLDKDRKDGVSQIEVYNYENKEWFELVKKYYLDTLEIFESLSTRQKKKSRKHFRREIIPNIKSNYFEMCDGNPYENGIDTSDDKKLKMVINHICDITMGVLLKVIPNDDRNGLHITNQLSPNQIMRVVS